jgi:uncharacterized protein YigE (DUF2233 family)
MRLPVSPASMKPCLYGVQRGPVLLPDTQYPSSFGKERYQRTVAAVDADGKLYVMVTKDVSTLEGVARFFYTLRPDLKIKSVLNLDGGESSGLLLAVSGQPPVVVGNVNGLVASALEISKKKK